LNPPFAPRHIFGLLLLVAACVLLAVGAAVQLQDQKTSAAPSAIASARPGSVPPAGTSPTEEPDPSVLRSQVPPLAAQLIETDGSFGRCTADAGSGSETWKAYESARYGYSICYPSGAELNSQTPATVGIVFTESFDTETGAVEGEQLEFEIDVHANPNGLSPREWADTIDRGPVDMGAPHAVTVNGLPGYQVSKWEFDQFTVSVCVSGGPRMYVLSFVDPLSPDLAFPEPLQAKYVGVFAQMLQSFSLR
jgi:hypothetical protein